MARRGQGHRVGVVGVAEPGASLKQQIEAAGAVLVAVFQDLVLGKPSPRSLRRAWASCRRDCGLNKAREEQDNAARESFVRKTF